MASGVMSPNAPVRRLQMVTCAFVDICWPTMQLTSAANKSGVTSRRTGPIASMASASRSSRAFR